MPVAKTLSFKLLGVHRLTLIKIVQDMTLDFPLIPPEAKLPSPTVMRGENAYYFTAS
ncbi:hypothetical protein [Anabaena sp. CA = ATCC 33047]|uniref:hypothetical protein n=1 Tax=Anabaena sp. (strain CA / ATCC 33047) TaxID=52271 RepID=UPI000ABD09D2|nr:hypothetical protein [Anabaena sp. CA = ATCC 33047]